MNYTTSPAFTLPLSRKKSNKSFTQQSTKCQSKITPALDPFTTLGVSASNKKAQVTPSETLEGQRSIIGSRKLLLQLTINLLKG